MSSALRLTVWASASAWSLVIANAVAAATRAITTVRRAARRTSPRLESPGFDFAGMPVRMIALLEVVQVDQHLVQAPVEHHRTGVVLAQELGHDLERRLGGAVEAAAYALDPLENRRACRPDLLAHLAEGTRMPGQAQVAVQAVHHIQGLEVLAGRVRRIAEVVIERDAPEQVVARDQESPVGLVQADMRGGVPRRLVDLPAAEVGHDLHSRDEVHVGLDEAVDAERLAAARLVRLRDQRVGNAALAGHLHPAT